MLPIWADYEILVICLILELNLQNERFGIISELKPLAAENKQYNEAVSEKLKAIEPLRNRLGKFRDENNAIRAQGAGICSSIEELEKSVQQYG